MKFDFTLNTYQKLLNGFRAKDYQFQTFAEYLKAPKEKVVILRHDVDRLPENALIFARIQFKLGIRGSYYFRSVNESWNDEIIREISNMGHEVGYHYENLTSVSKYAKLANCKNNPDHILNLGLLDFKNQLTRLRKLVPVETICMHGSPISKYDSKDLWEKYNYSVFDIIGEPYFDLDFRKVFYLTDTGRRWDGFNVSVRDKINDYQKKWNTKGLCFRTSFDVLKALEEDMLPFKIMITFHPQRWNDLNLAWCKELIYQNLKNPVKKGLIHFRKLRNA